MRYNNDNYVTDKLVRTESGRSLRHFCCGFAVIFSSFNPVLLYKIGSMLSEISGCKIREVGMSTLIDNEFSDWMF